MTGDVFISYSRHDAAYVTGLAAFLDAAGLPVWYDYGIQPGEEFAEKIRTAIDVCAAVVVVCTPAATASKWVRREVTYADGQHKPLVPLLLGQGPMPMEVATLQSHDVQHGGMPGPVFVSRLRLLCGLPIPLGPDEPYQAGPTAHQRPASAEAGLITNPVAQVEALQRIGEMLRDPSPPPSAFTDAEDLARRVTRRSTRDTMFAAIVGKLASRDPARARHIAGAIEDRGRFRAALQAIAEVWASTDLPQAMALLAEIAFIDQEQSEPPYGGS